MDRPVEPNPKSDADRIEIARPREACVLLQEEKVNPKMLANLLTTADRKAIAIPGGEAPVVEHFVPDEQSIVGIAKPKWEFDLNAVSVAA